MRLAAVTTLALALAIPASAEAAPIRECGDYNMDTGRLTFGSVPSGVWLGNVTVRGTTCRTALRMVRSSGDLPGWRCRNRQTAVETTDVRCTRGSRVIRYQTGA